MKMTNVRTIRKDMSKITLKKAEAELLELKDLLKSIEVRINENGGPKNQFWLMATRGGMRQIEKKIEDMKVNKIRTDELAPEDLKFQKRLEDLEKSIENITEKGK